MSTEPSCLFCKVLRGEVPAKKVHEDEHCVAFHDIRPVAPTHVLVIPRKHIVGPAAATDEDAEVLGRVMLGARAVATKLGLEEGGYRLVVNNGEHAGQSVFHLHMHVLGGRPFAWPPG